MPFVQLSTRKLSLVWIAVCSCLFTLFAANAIAAEPVPLSEYGKLPEIERAALSPSGERFAIITTIRGRRILLAAQKGQSQALSMTKVGDMKVRSIRWIDEDRLMLTTSSTIDLPRGFSADKFEASVAQIIPMTSDDGGGAVFAENPRYFGAVLGNYGVRNIRGTPYGFFGGMEYKRNTGGRSPQRWVFDHGRPHLFKVNLTNMEVEKVDEAARGGFSKDWIVDASGKLAFKLELNDTTGVWKIANASGKVIHGGRQRAGGINLVGLGFDGTSAIFVERGETRNYWYKIGPDGGEAEPFLDKVDFERLFFDPETGHLMGYTVGKQENERHVFYDPALEKKAEAIRVAFASFESWMSDWTSDLGTVIVRTSGNQDSGTYYTVDLATNRAEALAYERNAIGPEQVGAISTFEYTARDGMKMDGILTLPPGVTEPKNLPLVMMPHGGPHSADRPTFDWWAQAFASRGYAVFQPNFRGSTNRGAAFRRAGYGEWGRKMQTDKTDGLMALAEAGIVDPDRACIVGASYGGYAALAGVTIEQGLYKCAVAVAPVSDISAIYREDYRQSGRDRTTKTALREQLGDPKTWDEVSPRRLAQRADAPVMLIHGVDDTVVLYSHSAKMADKLKDAGKPYELVTLPGEDHWLSLSETRQQMLANAVRWVEAHNPSR